MKNAETMIELGLAIDNGECLEIMKRERDFIIGHIKSMKKDPQTTFAFMKEKVLVLQAHNVLIESFEEYLGHEK